MNTRTRTERRGFKVWVKDGWPEVRTHRYDFAGLVAGAVLGTTGLYLTMHLLREMAPTTSLGVVGVAAGLSAFVGSLLRVCAHFYPTPRGKGVDLAGKTIALGAALQVGLLGLYELGLI